jgi:hypothetical protein
MASLENEVQRCARDIGVAVTDILKTRIAQAVEKGEIKLQDRGDLARLLQLVDLDGRKAYEGALRGFYRKFDEYKAYCDEKPAPKK